MDSYQQQPHRYMRPPPPPAPPPPSMAADSHHLYHHHQPPPPPPPPPMGSWFPNQFQYHLHPSHSPSPPPPPPHPPQHNQWAPPHLPYHAQSNPPHSSQPYPPPPPPPHPPYPQVNQDWGNSNWTHHSGWEYPAHSNEEDWAARARAWASSRSTSETQHSESQFTSVSQHEEPSHYSNQYSQPVESHYQDAQQAPIPTSGSQYYQSTVTPLIRPPVVHQQEPASMSSYAPDGHFSFAVKDGALGGDISSAFSHHQGSTSSSSVHQQEVPSSYSYIPGKADGSEEAQHGRQLLPFDGRSVQIEQAHFAYGNNSLDPMDRPLEFTPRLGHENDPMMKTIYPDSVAPGVSYPPVTPFPSAPQHDLSIGVPPLPGQPAPMFGRGQSFQPAVPPITSPVVLGGGAPLHPTTAFPMEAYGPPMGSERPKKAAVPNWLREEIIKNKAVITSSVPEQFKEGTQPIEDESIDKSAGKGDQADSKSIDSSRSTEEEEDDEDYEAAKRTAAINKEIKRVLTEVLLKVTDELFDEIATKVLSEDDLNADVSGDPDNRPPKLSPPPPLPVPAPKVDAKVVVPVKVKEPETENASGESSSGSPGNVLGLANYTSDDDGDENHVSNVQSDSGVVHYAGENGHQLPEAQQKSLNMVHAEDNHGNGSSTGDQGNHGGRNSKLNVLDNGGIYETNSGSAVSLVKRSDTVTDDRKSIVKSDSPKSADNSVKTGRNTSDVIAERSNPRKSTKEDSQERDARRHDRHGGKRSSCGRDTKEFDTVKEVEDGKGESRGRQDERHQKKDKTEVYTKSKERSKEQGGKHGEKTRESDSRKRSPRREVKDSKKESEKDKKRSGKDNADRKRESKKDEKGDKSRDKFSSDGSRRKRRRSSSVDSRGKQSKKSPEISDGSSDDASESSRRKVNSRRRNRSPSPVKSRRRQVSRSPHSKHTQRRHSPYSTFDDGRGRRSRSRSPVRRHR